MTAPTITGVESPWESEGRRIANAFDGVTSAVLIAGEGAAAAYLALGIARVQARRRRVAIADCVGEIPPLQALLPRDAAHGIVDSVQYGVSLSKIAYPIDPAQNLFIMPSGAGPMDYAALLESDRWGKLASGFKEVDALLLIIAPANAPGLEALVASTDGSVVVGERRGLVPGPVLQEVQLAADLEPLRATAPRVAATSGPRASVTTGDQQAFDVVLRRRVMLYAGGGAAAVIVIALGIWLSSRSQSPPPPRVSAPVAPVGAAAIPRPVTDLRVENPQDSSRASPYSVDLVQLTAYNQAVAQLEQEDALQQQPLQRPAPATTIAPVTIENATLFHIIAGAYALRAQADSLLTRLRDDRQISPGTGRVVRAPYSLLVERNVARANASSFVLGYRRQGLPVYALVQSDGSTNLYAGAWETPEQAATLRDTFAQSGKEVTIVFRTGRVF